MPTESPDLDQAEFRKVVLHAMRESFLMSEARFTMLMFLAVVLTWGFGILAWRETRGRGLRFVDRISVCMRGTQAAFEAMDKRLKEVEADERD